MSFIRPCFQNCYNGGSCGMVMLELEFAGILSLTGVSLCMCVCAYFFYLFFFFVGSRHDIRKSINFFFFFHKLSFEFTMPKFCCVYCSEQDYFVLPPFLQLTRNRLKSNGSFILQFLQLVILNSCTA